MSFVMKCTVTSSDENLFQTGMMEFPFLFSDVYFSFIRRNLFFFHRRSYAI